MFSSVEARCIVCQLIFCCGDCRWKHEKSAHGLQYNCPICRGHSFHCQPKKLNFEFMKHLADEHLPLHCKKCDKMFNNVDDLLMINDCNSVSELIQEAVVKDIDSKFDSLYEKVSNASKDENVEEIITFEKSVKTAVVTPVVRRTHLVDYECSDSDEDEEKEEIVHKRTKTPHAVQEPKTPKFKKYRSATPHAKKLLHLVRQNAIDEYENNEEEYNKDSPKTPTACRNENPISEAQIEMTTPVSQLPHILKVAQVVTTSTPTHPLEGWSMFPEQGTDSPLSEIENPDSPSQNTNNEASKSESGPPPKLKSIIITGSKIRFGSQDSSEKHVTFQDSKDEASGKKKVKFAEDTVFEQEAKVKRVFRKPKRMLTPGPQRPKFCLNPRFQALINRFENKGMIMARTPVTNREDPQESTPPVGEPSNIPARAINFKEESPVVEAGGSNYSKESDESFKSCVASPNVSNAMTALTANIAGTLQHCLHSALRTTEENTEIQFKFVITKKTFSVKRIGEEQKDTDDHKTDVLVNVESQRENIWSSVARAVKNAFWRESGTSMATTTPHRSADSINSSSSSASKRKFDDTSDSELSPLNHKRQKYEGRIRGRPPLRRCTPWVSALRSSKSAEQQGLMHKFQEDNMNLSF